MIVRKLHLKFKKAAFVAGFLILCLQSPSAWAGNSYSASDLYYLAQKSYYQLIDSADKKKFRHHWEKVINDFSKVAKRYPKSPQAYKAVFTMASLYEGLNKVSKNAKDLERALHYYKKVSKDFSSGTLTDDALFESAKIYRDTKDFSSAAGLFKTVFEKYPNGDQARKARLQYKKLALSSKKTKNARVVSASTKKPAPVGIKQVLSSKQKQLKKITTPPLKVKEAKRRPDKKTVVASRASVSSRPPVKKALFKKSPGGHLYSPSKGKVKGIAPLIVVDAGHGGKDQGAKSTSGIHEKNINLTIARHIKTILVNRFKYQVVMTRKDDTFIPLKERSEIANNRNADLFVSIHANAAERKSAHGIETYFLGRANNAQALATAARENGELVHSVKDNQVQEILASLITTTKINDSSRLAGAVQESLVKSSKKKFRELKNLGVKEGPFYVLHGADMPSILVEVGFLTNKKESRMLSKPDYLYRQASSIAEAIHKYLQDKEPSI